jgi:alpha-galactosidase
MKPSRTVLHFRDALGVVRNVVLDVHQVHNEHEGLTLSSRIEKIRGDAVVHAMVTNRGRDAVRLDSVCFDLPSGFSCDTPARFFKHGYQSWSSSYPVAVGMRLGARVREDLAARLAHQSEITRPAETPENAISELFTIIESSSSSDRLLAGFIGSANQLTNLTVTTPDLIVARALLDGAILRPNESVQIEPLVCLRSGESAARLAARWAAMLGEAMRARVHAPYQRGWCSWYQYFHNISEDVFISNLRMLKELRSEYPLEIVQLDDGYQAALGDWTRTNPNFPSGLKRIADQIRDSGFTAGLWTAPFLACRDSQLMREHPDWFITTDGNPVGAAQVPDWTNHDDKFAYALDSSDPSVTSHLEQLYSNIVSDFGFEYLKLDFLFAGAVEGNRRDAGVTRAQSLRRGLEAIRRGSGEQAFILGCGCPLGPAVGIVDGMRIGPDVAPHWGVSAGGGEAGTVLAIDAIVARSFMHRRLWLNDPDCLMLRAEQSQLSADEREALAWTIAASGGMLLISDDMSLLNQASSDLYRAVAEIGAQVDTAARAQSPAEENMLSGEELKSLSCRICGDNIKLFVNKSERSREVRLLTAVEDWSRTATRGTESGMKGERSFVLLPHSARIIKCTSDSSR